MQPANHHVPSLNIAVFGRLNAGKSSLVNAFVGYEASEVSPQPGTTAETKQISADIVPLGRTTLVDTVGFHDSPKAGERWVDMLGHILDETDVALLVIDAAKPELSEFEYRLLATMAPREIPVITVLNKVDLIDEKHIAERIESAVYPTVAVSARTGRGMEQLRSVIVDIRPDIGPDELVGDLVDSGETIILIMPAESNAPRRQLEAFHSRLLREALDEGCLILAVRESELPLAMTSLTRPPALVVADTTNFDRLVRLVPPDIPLTSVNILAARQKGNLGEFVAGVRALSRLRPGERVLIAEGCSHRPFDEDMQNDRVPMLLKSLVSGPLRLDFVHGDDFPDSLRGYDLVVHCAGCILSRKEMVRRQALGKRDGVSVINYGILRTYVSHCLPRALSPLRQNGAIGQELDDVLTIENAHETRPQTRARALQRG